MMNKMSTELCKYLQPKKTLKILTCPTHEGYQTMLGETGHEFYMLSGENIKTWDFHTRPLPKNHYIFNLPVDHMRGDIQFDLILCQNRLQQYQMLKQISERTGLPMVIVDHTEPPPGILPHDMEIVKNFQAEQYVFITDYNRKSWGYENAENATVIRHGIDTDIFCGYSGVSESGISVVNQFPQRDVFCGWEIWQQIAKEVPMGLLGDNPGLSQSINNSYELARMIGQHRFFLNTSQLSPVPLSLLEAMAVGCPPISTAKQEIPSIIENGVNGLISNDVNELIDSCKYLLSHPDEAKRLGSNARQTILDRFSLEQFIRSWNNTFEKAINNG